MVGFDNKLEGKTVFLFSNNFDPVRKYVYAPVYSLLKYQVMKMLLNHLLQTLCNLIVR